MRFCSGRERERERKREREREYSQRKTKGDERNCTHIFSKRNTVKKDDNKKGIKMKQRSN